jgi:hypothetical protein
MRFSSLERFSQISCRLQTVFIANRPPSAYLMDSGREIPSSKRISKQEGGRPGNILTEYIRTFAAR